MESHLPAGRSLALRVLLPFGLAYFTSYWLRVISAVIAPDLVRELNLTASELGFMSAAYFIAFGAFQIPLGVLLDRFGARRVHATLVACAVVGAFLFSRATSVEGLTLARALIGLGMSAGLLASIKAVTVWFPAAGFAETNGWIFVIGALGALSASTPAQLMLSHFTWRDLVGGASMVALLAVALLVLVAPKDAHSTNRDALGKQLLAVGRVYASRRFWRIACVAMLSQATYMGIQSLWAGPWLVDVGGLSRAAAANYLLAMSVAMIAGSLTFGHLGSRLARAGRLPVVPFIVGVVLFCSVQGALAAGWRTQPLLAWVLFGYFGTAGSLAFAILPRYFPAALTGRAITALNVLIFSLAFACQWGLGAIIHLWPEAAGRYHPHGYQAGFAACLVLQVLALAWFFVERRGQAGLEELPSVTR